MAMADLTALSRAGGDTASAPRPRRRVLTRIVVPAAIILGAAALLAYAGRESLRPAIDVIVAPVVLMTGTSGAARSPTGEAVQAPGWIEADPYDIGVPALASGVLKELRVLEGQRVAAGDVVATLVDDDAKLAVQRAGATLAEADATHEQATADEGAEEARLEELHDDLDRKQSLVKTGAISEGDVAQLRLRISSHNSVCARREGCRQTRGSPAGRRACGTGRSKAEPGPDAGPGPGGRSGALADGCPWPAADARCEQPIRWSCCASV